MAEIASAYVALLPSFKGGKAAISKELDGPVEEAGRSGGERYGTGMASSIGASAKRIIAPLAAAFAGIKVVDFFKDAVSGASDLNEASTKIDAIFGDASGAVNAFAATGAKALGQTKLQVLDAAATFGTFGKAAGKTGPDLATFSTGLAGLSTDLASFFNTSPAEAAEAIAAGLRGEAEPLRQYGVLLDDATLRARALSLGLISTTKDALTPQQKVLAAQAEIFAQTSDAQGDFQRTSGGLANQQRILSATFSDLRTSIGQKFLPVVITVVKFFNDNMVPTLTKVKDGAKALFDLFVKGDFTGAFSEIFGVEEDSGLVTFLFRVRDAVIEAFGKGTEIVKGFAAFITGTLVPGIVDLVTWGTKNKDWILPLAVGIGTIVAAIQLYNVAMGIYRAVTVAASIVQAAFNVVLSANPIGIIILAIAGLVAGLVFFFTQTETGQRVWAVFTAFLSAAWVEIQSVFNRGLGVITGVFTWIRDHWPLLLAIITGPIGIAALAIITHWDTIKSTFSAGVAALVGFFTGLPGKFAAALSTIASVITAPFRAGFNAVAGLWNRTIGSLDFNVPDWIPGIGGKGFSFPKIPQLAEGALITRPTLAMVGEGRESEWVLPQSKLDALVASAAGNGFPEAITLVDADGSILARTRVVVGNALTTRDQTARLDAASRGLTRVVG